VVDEFLGSWGRPTENTYWKVPPLALTQAHKSQLVHQKPNHEALSAGAATGLANLDGLELGDPYNQIIN
jgi:hypothetical protein